VLAIKIYEPVRRYQTKKSSGALGSGGPMKQGVAASLKSGVIEIHRLVLDHPRSKDYNHPNTKTIIGGRTIAERGAEAGFCGPEVERELLKSFVEKKKKRKNNETQRDQTERGKGGEMLKKPPLLPWRSHRKWWRTSQGARLPYSPRQNQDVLSLANGRAAALRGFVILSTRVASHSHDRFVQPIVR